MSDYGKRAYLRMLQRKCENWRLYVEDMTEICQRGSWPIREVLPRMRSLMIP